MRSFSFSNIYWIIILFSICVSAQAQTPTENIYLGNNGIYQNANPSVGGNNRNFNLHPDVLTTGSLIVVDGEWADVQTLNENGGTLPACASHCAPTFTDNASNTLTPVFTVGTCIDTVMPGNHGFYYDQNIANTTFNVVEAHSVIVSNNSWNISNWIGVQTTASGFVDASSCKVDVTPVSNTAPNITGTAMTINNANDLVLVRVDDEGTGLPTLGPANPWGALTVPAGCTLLEHNINIGHVVMQCTPGVGTFTPTFTVSQTTHDPFAIYAVAFRSGAGGSTTPSIAQVLMSQKNLMPSSGSTDTLHVPCPTGTTTLVVTDGEGATTSISDSNSDTFTSVHTASFPKIYYKNGLTFATQAAINAFTVTIVNPAGNSEMITYYCTNATGVDSGVTAGANGGGSNASFLEATGVVRNSQTENTTVGGNAICFGTTLLIIDCADLPTLVTSLANDLIVNTCVDGTGPMAQMTNPSGAVMDSPYPTQTVGAALANWGSATTHDADADYYTDGDANGHFFAASPGSYNFHYAVQNNAASVNCYAIALAGAVAVPGPPNWYGYRTFGPSRAIGLIPIVTLHALMRMVSGSLATLAFFSIILMNWQILVNFWNKIKAQIVKLCKMIVNVKVQKQVATDSAIIKAMEVDKQATQDRDLVRVRRKDGPSIL
jgi:hypothetical protein